MKSALITGVTGQDGSYLAEYLLNKGYEVYGLVRRLSVPNLGNMAPIADRITIVDGDLMDQSSLHAAVKAAEPDEVYNLAAQSFVGTSFVQPVLTGEITGLGAVRVLEAVRSHAPDARVYQASSSEMFGKVDREPQDESTSFHPRSPYGVAKVYAYWACINYREAHNLYVSNGILFNHESCPKETPLIVRRPGGLLDCLPISEVVPDPRHHRQRQMDVEVWDRGAFTRVNLATAYWNSPSNDRRLHRVVARCGEVRATAEHQFILSDGTEREAERLEKGERLMRTELPPPPGRTHVTADYARLLGLLAAEGSVSYSHGRYSATFRNNDPHLLDMAQMLWESTTGGRVSESPGVSGFTGEPTGGLSLLAEGGTLHALHDTLYTRDLSKRVPRIVLNATAGAWRAFLLGYNDGDGLRAGNGTRTFKNFKSASPVLAAGLWWMASKVLNQKLTLNVDFVDRGEFEPRMYAYYSINLGVEGGPTKGRHLLRPSEEAKRIVPEAYTGWLYDLATESGTFHAGVGDLVIHNSPRRGLEFVTRKVAHGVARIAAGKAKTLSLGNLDAKRDWGYAPQYVDLMWRCLQPKTPDDFVGATGEAHSVREFVEEAFRVAGVGDWEKHVVQEEKNLRPSEVFNLRGDASKAKRELGWEAKTRFKELVRIMVEAELERAK
ncbi:MAG: GDP-mannose 4,6-dehydratase [Thermoplasmata archaeon]